MKSIITIHFCRRRSLSELIYLVFKTSPITPPSLIVHRTLFMWQPSNNPYICVQFFGTHFSARLPNPCNSSLLWPRPTIFLFWNTASDFALILSCLCSPRSSVLCPLLAMKLLTIYIFPLQRHSSSFTQLSCLPSYFRFAIYPVPFLSHFHFHDSDLIFFHIPNIPHAHLRTLLDLFSL